MNRLIIVTCLICSGFLAGQYSIMYTFNPDEWYEDTIQLARSSYENGCNDATLDLVAQECKKMSLVFEEQIRATKTESK